MKRICKKGASLIEVVVGAAIILLVVTSIVASYTYFLRLGLSNISRVQAAYLLEEGMESLRSMRDASWIFKISSLSTSTPFRFHFDSNWQATTSNTFIDSKFDRTFTLTDVFRSELGEIVSSGGVYDPGTKKVSVSVSWRTSEGTTTKTVSGYMTNLFAN
jgi:type II secretory pathway pseudopilin PulG